MVTLPRHEADRRGRVEPLAVAEAGRPGREVLHDDDAVPVVPVNLRREGIRSRFLRSFRVVPNSCLTFLNERVVGTT